MEPMPALYTRAEYDLLPEGFPAQLIEGQLVRDPSPAFGHQRVALAIAEKLKRLVGPQRIGIAPIDIVLDDFNVYQPDVVVFRTPVEDDAQGEDVGIPLLAVEVLSPSTARRDRIVKRTRLLDAGVEEVWLIDRVATLIEVYDRGRYRDLPRRVTRSESVASRALPGFALTPDALYA